METATQRWFTDPCKEADASITRGGLSEMRKRFSNEVVHTEIGQQTPMAIGGDDSMNGTLVRGRGMVQDISTMQRLSVIREFPKAGKVLFSAYPENEASTSEEMVNVTFVYLSLVPGENFEFLDVLETRAPTRATKRRLSDPDNDKGGADPDVEMDDNIQQHDSLQSNNFATVDKVRNVTTMEGTSQHSGFVIRLYDIDEDLRLNEIMEFWGVIHPDESAESDVFSYIPQSLIKTVHCFWFSKAEPVLMQLRCDVLEVREQLLSYLKQLVGGDTFAAEMMLLHLISSVTEHEPVPIGTLPLNISNCSAELASQIVGGLRMVTSVFVAHKITVPELNKLDWIPVMDYDKEHLRTGRLQLANSTYLVFDETGLEQGTLHQQGIQNVRAITGIANDQRIEYPCACSTLELKTNYPTMVLSTGSSILRLSTTVPLLVADSGQTISRRELAGQYDLVALREYIKRCRCAPATQTKMEDFEEAMCASMASMKGEFPAHYKETPAIAESPVHCWMTLARLFAISKGDRTVTSDHWNYAVSLGRELLRRKATAAK
eukprot:TRINITY_DN1212_c2_g1_i1.p1 TRINITY_DN1212_c2_g1~~TRINITY_DN1212_c2_g1_i1.p1  ORF type:complete len:547 (+),score=79.40 TRINITY_DN1212_c2_g1_i1:37-1677(+)